jgi:hypothetical protein
MGSAKKTTVSNPALRQQLMGSVSHRSRKDFPIYSAMREKQECCARRCSEHPYGFARSVVSMTNDQFCCTVPYCFSARLVRPSCQTGKISSAKTSRSSAPPRAIAAMQQMRLECASSSTVTAASANGFERHRPVAIDDGPIIDEDPGGGRKWTVRRDYGRLNAQLRLLWVTISLHYI